jgi:hypothetical protein
VDFEVLNFSWWSAMARQRKRESREETQIAQKAALRTDSRLTRHHALTLAMES